MILIDTSVLSRTLRRRKPGPEEMRLRAAVDELMAGDISLGLPGIVLQELLSGIRNPRQFAALHDHLINAFTIVLAEAVHHVDAARLRNTCLTAGLSVSGPDCLIATLAIAGAHQLLARDNDFVAIARHSALQVLTV